MQKTVSGNARFASAALDGTECAVTFNAGNFRAFAVRNDGEESIYISCRQGFSQGDDGVVMVPSGQSVVYKQVTLVNTIYLSGNGQAAIVAQNDFNNPFKSGGKGGVAVDVLLPAGKYASSSEAVTLDLNGSMADYTFCVLTVTASTGSFNCAGQDVQGLIFYNIDDGIQNFSFSNAKVYVKGYSDLTPSQIMISANNLGKNYAVYGIR